MAAGFHFKGTISVIVSPDRLKADLAISLTGDLEYDEGSLVRVLKDAGVTDGFDPNELTIAIQQFQRSRKSQGMIAAAEGVPSIAATPETWTWNPSEPVSEAEHHEAEQRSKLAGPPELYRVKIEQVTVKKPLVEKGKPPALQTVVETRQQRQKVLVDASTAKFSWVEAQTVVATIQPSRPGTPGKDVSGLPVPPAPVRSASFLLGAHLLREKNEVRAQRSGLLRVGNGWADIVPVLRERWSIKYSSDKSGAYLSYDPGEPPRKVTAELVRQRLEADGFPAAAMPSADSLRSVLESAVRSGHPLVESPLVVDEDGRFEITYNADHTKAFLHLVKPLGRGQALDLKILGASLREAQLKGFSFESVKDALQTFLSNRERELSNFLLATGTPPSRGKDLVIRYLVPFVSDEKLAEIQAAMESNPGLQDTVPDRDMLPIHKVQKAALVKTDQEFAILEPPEDDTATEGMDVHGKPIPALRGNEPALELLANVRKSGNSLAASIDGLLEGAIKDGTTFFRVRPHQEAVATVTRSSDNLEAFLTLVQGRGAGSRLTMDVIDGALVQAQIAYGLDRARIEEALKTATAGGRVEAWKIAQGRPAGNDLGRRLEFQGPPRVDAQGKQRFSVRTGELVARYLVPRDDQLDGVDVLGNPIPSPDLDLKPLAVSDDFQVSSEGESVQLIVSGAGGDAIFDGESLTLQKQVAVAAVGPKAGNVKFTGEVIVTGTIESGGYVVAGNLKVRGRVGGALLSSDHNIQVADGIHGEGKAVLRAKKHVSVGFVERSLVMAVGDVHIGKTALGCTFRVNGKIYQKFPGGGLTGGSSKVRLGLDVMNLGSPSGVATLISFGQDYLVEDQIQAEVKETDKLRDAIVQIDVFMRNLVKPEDRDRLNAARQKKVLLMKLLDKRNLKLIYLRDKFDLHVPSEIIVRESLFPGVSIESHGRLYEPKGRRTAVRIRFNESSGHIEEMPL